MPSNVVKSIAEKAKKSVEEVEKLWDKAKKIVKDEYPEVAEDSERFYMLVTGVLKNMVGLKESFEDLIKFETDMLKKLVEAVSSEKEEMKKDDSDEEVEEEEEEDEEDKDKMKKSDEDEEVEDSK